MDWVSTIWRRAWTPFHTRCSPVSATAITAFIAATDRPLRQSTRMRRRDATFICQSCGAVYSRWQGKCDACGEWNTVAEESSPSAGAHAPGRKPRKGRLFPLEALTGAAHQPPRLASGLAEFDRVTGGGFVRGSVLLLGGDPGIGKSTLLVQVAAALARGRHRAVFISGEEAVAQVRLRAERLGLGRGGGGRAGGTAHGDSRCTRRDR